MMYVWGKEHELYALCRIKVKKVEGKIHDCENAADESMYYLLNIEYCSFHLLAHIYSISIFSKNLVAL